MLPKDCAADSNLFYCAGDPEYGSVFTKKMHDDGVELHSISADPLLVFRHDLGADSSGNGDLRLMPDSPAFALGFEPIDMSQIGLQRQKRE